MNLISWVVLGLIAGIVARIIAPNNSNLVTLGNFLAGIIGAFGGGIFATFYTLSHLALMATHISIFGIGLAILGAIVAVFVWQVIIQSTF